jgi:hypothetical protein
MKKISMAILTLYYLLFTVYFAMAQKPTVILSEKAGWHKIAENHVSYKTDADSVYVLWNDHFREVKLKAKDADVNLQRFDVVFEDGSTQSIPLSGTLKKGDETVSTPLTNKSNAIRKIVLVYNTVPPTMVGDETEREKAEVEIWGLK